MAQVDTTSYEKRGIIDATMNKMETYMNPDVSNPAIAVSTKFKEDPNIKMLAAEWHGAEDVRMVERAAPDITDSCDAIIRTTAMTICGSDLHMYFAQPPVNMNMHKGDILGHESMGVVEKVGPGVTNIKVGQRVVISAPISCGKCEFCKQERYSLCESTNPSSMMESLYGQRTSGLFGYSHLTGGFAGGQAEYVRVPFADVNLLPVPDNLPDWKVLLLSDVICTAWHGLMQAQVVKNSRLAIWGAGPIGSTAAYLAKALIGVPQCVIIDNNEERLARIERVAGVQIINFDQTKDVVAEVQRLIPGGPTNCIDCVGFRFPKSMGNWLQMKLKLQTDVCEVPQEIITSIRKGGSMALIGDYFGSTNNFPIGALMEKAINLSGGQLYCQKYWKDLLGYIEKGQIDMSWLLTDSGDIKDLPAAYAAFGKQAAHKYFISTPFGRSLPINKGGIPAYSGNIISNTTSTTSSTSSGDAGHVVMQPKPISNH